MKKLAIVLSHPIQYFGPLFKVLSREIEMQVFYFHRPTPAEIGESGFEKAFEWDVDLLDGYGYEFLENVSKSPSVSEYKGCDTPKIGNSLKSYGATHVVVFGWYLKAHRQTIDYCNKNDIAIAVRGDSQLNPHQSLLKRCVKQIYYPFFLKKFTAFLYVGQRNKTYLKSFGVSNNRLIFSPHAVDQTFWKVRKIENETFNFVWIAKFIEKKRPLDVILAFKKAAENNPGIRLNMIGSGPLLENCKAIANNHPQISFLGFKNQTQLKDEYSRSDALILSSDFGETWGLVVNEAFAAGIPAIVSDACGCHDDLIEEYTGLSFPMGDIEALTLRIVELMNLMTSIEGSRNKVFKAIENKNEIYSYARNVVSFKKFLEY